MPKTVREKLPAVSIIVPTLNEEHYLPLLLDSLVRADASMEIIVVDGNSTDGTVRAARKFVPQFSGDRSLRIVSSERGISVQRNYGAALAKHAFLLFLDADVVIPSAAAYEKFVSEFAVGGYAVASPLIVGIERHLVSDVVYAGFHLLQRMYL